MTKNNDEENPILEGYDEIIAIMVKGRVISGIQAIQVVKIFNDFDQLIRRAHIKMMVICDMGKRWEDLYKEPTLFRLDENDHPYALEGDVMYYLKPKDKKDESTHS